MSSPSTSVGPAGPTSRKGPRQTSKRSKLRNATFIIPSTRERVKRHITLRNPNIFEAPPRVDGESSDEELTMLSFDRRESFAENVRRVAHNIRAFFKRIWQWMQSPMGRGVLKSSFAYMLGCMGTYVPFLSAFLGNQDGKHMVATMIVYLHPARSAGAMIEAVILGTIAFLYAMFISVSSMAVAVVCETQFGFIELGYIIVLVVFCGGGLGFVGWIKQRMGTPLVNVACSLTSLAIITVLTKENAVQTGVFSNHKIVQIAKMFIMALISSTSINLLVWPVSARTELRKTMISVTDAFGDMLTTIAQSFLSGSEVDLRSGRFEAVSKRYRTLLAQLNKNLKEAKAEHYFLGTEKEYINEAKLVNCMQRVAQAVGGLRSAAATQFTLLRESENIGSSTPHDIAEHSMPQIHGIPLGSSIRAKLDRFPALSDIDEDPNETSEQDENTEDNRPPITRQTSFGVSTNMPTVRSPAEIFSRFIDHLGPSMKSLAYTLSQILKELPFGDGPEFKITVHEHFRTSLGDALSLYKSARREALVELYKSKDLGKERPESIEADFEEVAASCGYFSFSLQDFAEELQKYLEILEDLKDVVDQPSDRSWEWLKFWRHSRSNAKKSAANADPERENLIGDRPEHEGSKGIREVTIVDVRKSYYENATGGPISQHILGAIKFLERDDIRFALKVGIGASLWAMFSYIPATRPFYGRWRGEWGLLSYMLVCSMTVGASNTTGWARFIGTIIGALLSTFNWLVCQGNVFALAFCGWLVSVGCFDLIVAKGQAPFGRFILLTYNLSALYAYSLSVREGDDDEDEGGANPMIFEIAMHRLVAVISGVLWGLMITRIIWPISARDKFKDGLSTLWLRMGLIWKRDPLSAIVDGSTDIKPYMDPREQAALQVFVAHLENLRNAATSEFELRGPFAKEAYGRIMSSTNKMLDAFHALNAIILKDLRASKGEAQILEYTSEERVELSARISHLFQVLASSMKLEYPLNDAMPGTENSRDRLLAKIFHFRRLGEEEAEGEPGAVTDEEEADREDIDDEDYALLYAYALVTGQLAEEIKRVSREIEGLFGVLDEELIQLY